jgi:hypothetical protein
MQVRYTLILKCIILFSVDKHKFLKLLIRYSLLTINHILYTPHSHILFYWSNFIEVLVLRVVKRNVAFKSIPLG